MKMQGRLVWGLLITVQTYQLVFLMRMEMLLEISCIDLVSQY